MGFLFCFHNHLGIQIKTSIDQTEYKIKLFAFITYSNTDICFFHVSIVCPDVFFQLSLLDFAGYL